MKDHSAGARALVISMAWAGLFVAPLHAQEQDARQQPAAEPGLFETNLHPADPDPDLQERYRHAQRTRSEMERELRKLRAEYFRSIRNPQIRQAGIVKLRQYTDPVIFPSLIEIFARDGDDVRGAILDHLVDQQHDDADTVVAWIAVFDKDKNYRAMATQRLQHRVALAGGPTTKIKSVVAEGLRRSRDDEVASAAELAAALNLAEAIPMLINAQVVVRGSGSGGGQERSLAWILVGQQQAFVSGLTPVVGPSSVAFDPQLSVLTTGTVLRVIDAVVVTYRIDVHNALVRLTSNLWERPTAHLGYDGPAWASWYTNEFLPYWKAKQAAERSAAPRKQNPAPETPAEPPAPPGGG
jgi:hypothetical protein